jgi:hypothetical protein
VVNRKVTPHEHLSTPATLAFVLAVPQQATLLGREGALVVLVFEEGVQDASQNLGAPLAIGCAVGVTLNRKQVTREELLGLLGWLGPTELLP